MSDSVATPAQEFGHYDVYESLGHGGIGETFVARLKRDTAAGRDAYVCLKMMGREFQAARADRRKQAIESLRHEARIVAGFDHPAIARLLDSGSYNDVWFLAFELVNGANLDEILAMRRPGEGLEPEHVRRIGIAIASALQHAHERQVLHRDIKPSNILISTDGAVKLVDFGLAKANAQAATDFTVGVGTPRYWAPEQILQDSLTEATDLFALGVVLYELLATTHPFYAETNEAFRRNIVRGKKRPLTDFGVPIDLAMIVECCLEVDPRNRFLSARALHNALRSGAKVSGFEFEIGQLADAARDAVAEHRPSSSDPSSEGASLTESTVHAPQDEPTRHLAVPALAGTVRESVPRENEFRDEVLSDLSRMARDAMRRRESHTQARRRRGTTIAEILPSGDARKTPTEPPTAAESIRARKREGTLAEDPFAVSSHGAATGSVETRREVSALEPTSAGATQSEVATAEAPKTTHEVRARRPTRRRDHSLRYGLFALSLGAIALGGSYALLRSAGTSRVSESPTASVTLPSAATPIPNDSPAASPEVQERQAPEPPSTAAVQPDESPTAAPTAAVTPTAREQDKLPKRRREASNRAEPNADAVKVTIGLIPYGEVTVDGRKLGSSPVVVALAPGKHRVIGRGPAGSRSMMIVVEPDSTSFVLDLRDDAKSSR